MINMLSSVSPVAHVPDPTDHMPVTKALELLTA